jgi:hypothetical protein
VAEQCVRFMLTGGRTSTSASARMAHRTSHQMPWAPPDFSTPQLGLISIRTCCNTLNAWAVERKISARTYPGVGGVCKDIKNDEDAGPALLARKAWGQQTSHMCRRAHEMDRPVTVAICSISRPTEPTSHRTTPDHMTTPSNQAHSAIMHCGWPACPWQQVETNIHPSHAIAVSRTLLCVLTVCKNVGIR